MREATLTSQLAAQRGSPGAHDAVAAHRDDVGPAWNRGHVLGADDRRHSRREPRLGANPPRSDRDQSLPYRRVRGSKLRSAFLDQLRGGGPIGALQPREVEAGLAQLNGQLELHP